MYSKNQIIQKISQISRQKYKLDDLYVTLQKSVASYQTVQGQAKSVVKMRQDFNTLISQISMKILQRTKDLDALKYRCQKLTRQQQQMTSQQRNIDSLSQYFTDLKHKVSLQKKKGQQIISQKQRWQLKGEGQFVSQEQMSLLNSNRTARQANQMADGVLQNLMTQSNRLSNAKNRMGDVLKNMNLAANITMMIRTRTRQDNKLILWLTVGLLVEIFLCLFIIKPWIRGD